MAKALATVVAAIMLVPTATVGGRVDLADGVRIRGGASSSWTVRDNHADRCTVQSPPKGVSVHKGSFATGEGRLRNAFDSGHQIFVSGRVLNDSDGQGERSGNSVRSGPERINGLTVSVTHTALRRNATVRTLVRLRNETDSPKSRTISIHSNGGGDAAEDTMASSDGDDRVEPDDRWVVWKPRSGRPGVATKVSALMGPHRKRVDVTAVKQQPGDRLGTRDCLWVNYRVAVPADGVRYLLFFTRLSDGASQGRRVAEQFTREKSYLFKGMTTTQRRQSVNWSLFGNVPDGYDWDALANEKPNNPSCDQQRAEECIIDRGSGPHIHLFGDSHARMLVPTFKRMAKRHDLTFSAGAAPGCAWQRGLLVDGDGGGDGRCGEFQDDQYGRVIPALKPDVVTVISVPRDDPNGRPRGYPWAGGMDAYRKRTAESVDHLVERGYRVVIFEHVPYSSFPPLQCMKTARKIAECAFRRSPSPLRSEKILRGEDADRERVTTIDLDPIACPYLPLCAPVIGRMVAWRDVSHLHPDFARAISGDVFKKLKNAAVFRGL